MGVPFDVNIYQPGTEGDAPLLKWYGQLVEAGDLSNLLGPSLHPLGAFMRYYINPDLCLMYDEDDKGWLAVSWFSVFMGGGTWSFWIRSDYRCSGSRRIMRFGMAGLSLALEHTKVLINTTKQPSVVAKTERLGYKYLGVVPLLFEGEDCHILYMTREMFQPLRDKWQAYQEKHNGRSDRRF